MEKRRVFKRSKSTPAEKKPEKKAAPIKKHVEKKVMPVLQEKPVEKSVQHKESADIKKYPEPVAETVTQEASVEEMPETTTDAQQIPAEQPQNDIVVVEETTVTEVINSDEMSTDRKLSFIWIFLGIFVIFLAGGIIFLFLFQQPQKPEQVYTAPTDTPAPTKPAAPAKAAWKIEILNGSGVSGAAAKMAQKLEALGYTVVKTGNADATQEKTEYFLSKDFIPFNDSFAADLEKAQIAASNGGQLQNSSVSARIIIGTE